MKTIPVDEYVWEIPASEKPDMLVPARRYASERLLAPMDQGVSPGEANDVLAQLSKDLKKVRLEAKIPA